jgi:hypothetical protein
VAETEEPDEEVRLAERARRIWGDNPFSPEKMAEDAALKAPEREFKDQLRYRRMRDLKDEQE